MQNYNKYMYKLPANPLFPGRKVIFLTECHSTNDYLIQKVKEEFLADGSVVIADYQTAGKGMRGNTWISERGENLTFSILLRPVFLAASDQMLLNMACALGVADWLRKSVPGEVHIKWPNDVLLNRRKVCGMLIENQLHADKVAVSVVGIGLNINQVSFPFPHATSVRVESGIAYDLCGCFTDLIDRLDMRYGQLESGNRDAIKEDYLSLLFGWGREIMFNGWSGAFPGTILGVDSAGRLEVRTPWGVRLFAFKEIAYQWPLT
jgi:BirA family biotin operon repressor/biotin-[acetyl-CoA-carboxylase] ligase